MFIFLTLITFNIFQQSVIAEEKNQKLEIITKLPAIDLTNAIDAAKKDLESNSNSSTTLFRPLTEDSHDNNKDEKEKKNKETMHNLEKEEKRRQDEKKPSNIHDPFTTSDQKIKKIPIINWRWLSVKKAL